ncbi:MAG: hypothetical protein OXU23_26060 [Candidatus Poribacteria bacterium]|nr:hypothetical protein [Candidatus Poribacteria bacterium]
MFTITIDDIEDVIDEDTFMEFLTDMLHLPIPEDLTLEDITSIFSNKALGLSGFNDQQVLDCQELCISPDKPSDIILIRFKSETGYIGTLQAVAKGLDQQGNNPADLRFICTDEFFQPFAFAYFKDLAREDRRTAELNILSWTQDNTRISISSEHEIPADLFLNQSTERTSGDNLIVDEKDDLNKKEVILDKLEVEKEVESSKIESKTNLKDNVTPVSPDELLEKLQKICTPLGDTDWKIHKGVITGCNKAYVIEESKCQELIDEDPKSAEIIKLAVGKHQENLWKPVLKYIIWIPSSKNKQWEWADAKNETEAKKIFAQTYPAISNHLKDFEIDLKGRHASCKGKYSWEVTHREHKPEFLGPKITFYDKPPVVAYYDESDAIVVSPFVHCIPTTNFSMLAILNSKLAEWYVQNKYEKKGGGRLNKNKLKDFPVADITTKQKTELTKIVEQILENPESLNVPDLEEELNQLVYKLYELTPAEIKLIEEESNK